MINEPAPGDKPNLKMTTGHARLLSDDDPLMRELGLTQPPGAVASWCEHVRPQAAGKETWCCSERMLMYASTCKRYAPEVELTVDYGKSYQRSYASGGHRPSHRRPLYMLPPDSIDVAAPAQWPHLPGWFNPRRQPSRRPAFATAPDGTICVCADDPSVVAAARREALGDETETGHVEVPDARRASFEELLRRIVNSKVK